MQRQGSIGGSAAFRIRVTGGVLLVAHLAFVAWFTLRPLDVPWVMPANLRPFDGIRADLALGWPQAARRIVEGLALLAPLGVLLPMASGRLVVSPLASLLRTVAAGALLSLGIELLQTGVPGQVVDVDSLLLNAAGVALAHLARRPRGPLLAAPPRHHRAPDSHAPPPGGAGSGSDPDDSQGRDRPVERRFAPFVSVAWSADEGTRTEASHTDAPKEPHMSRLARPTHGRMIGGVCAALARRFGTSTTTMRVIFLVSCLLPGPQFLLYIALWILLPSEDKVQNKAQTAW